MFKLLSTRIFLLTFVLLCIIFSTFAFYFIQNQNKHLMDDIIYHAVQASEVVKRSTEYSMMQNRKQDAYHIINTIASDPGYEGIKIFGKAGNIIYSTDSTEVGRVVDMTTEACNHCHVDDEIIHNPSIDLATRIFSSPANDRILGLITPIYNTANCSGSGCHVDPSEKTILGVLDVRVSLTEIDTIFSESKLNITLFFLVSIVFSLTAVGIFVRFMVHNPVQELISGIREISHGNLDYTIEVKSENEIGELAISFNTMTNNLKHAQEENLIWSSTLEKQINEKTRDLQRAQSQIVHVEKMASLGKLSASVAHEINNPLAGILTYTKLLLKNLADPEASKNMNERLNKYLPIIRSETARCGDIVKNLLLFARKDKPTRKIVDIRDIVGNSLILVQHHIEMRNINLSTTLPDKMIPIYCDSNTIQQALIAILINAVESIDSGGTLDVSIDPDKLESMCVIQIRDSGHGIPKEILPNIFEPFFTTKEEDKGVGLGLSVVYGIIKAHKGEVRIESVVNKGTTVILELPKKNNNILNSND